jgi:hypothetical protein
MRVIDTRENMSIQGFQHCLESQLIEVSKLQMHRIQLVLIVNFEIDSGKQARRMANGSCWYRVISGIQALRTTMRP